MTRMGEAHPEETKAAKVSVVIPAYNEAKTSAGTLARVVEHFEGLCPYEIIVVDDGSSDGTAEVVRSAAAGRENIILISNSRNMGKGRSVRRGMERATGDVALVMDMDMAVPLDEAEKFLAKIKGGAQIVIASRYATGSRHRGPGFPRAAVSRMFNLMTRALLGLPYSDTQCGFKMMDTATGRRLLSKCKVDRFAYDAELLYLAAREGARVEESPVKCENSTTSKVRIFRDSAIMLKDLLAVRMGR